MAEILDYYNFVPTPKQAEFLKDPAKYKLFGGSMGGGKSIVLCAGVIHMSITIPRNRIFFGRHEYKSFKQSTMVDFMDMLPSDLIKSYNKTDGEIELVNGSLILLGGLENQEKIKSLNLGGFAIDEMTQTTEAIFNMLGTRLRLNTVPDELRFGWGASNPEPGWVKDRFVDPHLAGKPRRNHSFIQALPYDNSHLPKDYIEGLKDDLPPLWISKYIEGSWEVFDNQIINSSFIKKSDPIPTDLEEVFIAVDPAITETDDEKLDETAIVVMGVTKDNVIHEIESRHGRWSIQTTIQNCKELYEYYKPNFFGVEKVAYQDALRQLLQGMNIPCMPLKVDGDKVRRTFAISHIFEEGRVRLNNDVLIKQVLEFPTASKHGGHEDLHDAMVHCLTMYKKYSSPIIKKVEDPRDKLQPIDQMFWSNHDDKYKNSQAHNPMVNFLLKR